MQNHHAYAMLELAAAVVDDIERVRIANENRLRTFTRDIEDKDGEERGFGLTHDHPDVRRLIAMILAIKCDSKMVTDLNKEAGLPAPKPERRAAGCCLEHDAERNLKANVKAHPLGPWIASLTGVGEKQGARLIAAIGDPYWHGPENRPRRVSELWSLCGYGDAAKQVRRKGVKVTWNPTAKTRAYLVATSIVKCMNSPLRPVYDDARKKYADAVHAAPCVRCGPSGHPAAAGSALGGKHQQARGERAVAKAMLLSLWQAARATHQLPDGQANTGTQAAGAVG